MSDRIDPSIIEGLMSEINTIGSTAIGKISAEAVMSFWTGTRGLPRRLRRKLTEDFAMTIAGYYVVANQNGDYDQGPIEPEDPDEEYSE